MTGTVLECSLCRLRGKVPWAPDIKVLSEMQQLSLAQEDRGHTAH